jgi:hypothetical protein
VAPAFEHGQNIPLPMMLSPSELPTIYFGEASPPRTFGLPFETGGALDSLATLTAIPASVPGRAGWAELAWPSPPPIEVGRSFSLPLPAMDILRVSAADGRPLPPWLVFDPVAGTLAGTAPHDFSGTLALLLTVRDSQGQVHEVPMPLSATKAVPASHEGRSVAPAKPALAAQFGTQRHGGDHAALLRQLAVARQHAAPVHP